MQKIKYIRFKKYFPNTEVLLALSKIQDCENCLFSLVLHWSSVANYQDKHSIEFYDTELINFVSQKTLENGLHKHMGDNPNVH